jgi:hypothetical protein
VLSFIELIITYVKKNFSYTTTSFSLTLADNFKYSQLPYITITLIVYYVPAGIALKASVGSDTKL